MGSGKVENDSLDKTPKKSSLPYVCVLVQDARDFLGTFDRLLEMEKDEQTKVAQLHRVKLSKNFVFGQRSLLHWDSEFRDRESNFHLLALLRVSFEDVFSNDFVTFPRETIVCVTFSEKFWKLVRLLFELFDLFLSSHRKCSKNRHCFVTFSVYIYSYKRISDSVHWIEVRSPTASVNTVSYVPRIEKNSGWLTCPR